MGPCVGAFGPLDIRIRSSHFVYVPQYTTEYLITVINKALWTDLADQKMEMPR